MPLFQCSNCGCIENTALSDYWWRTECEKLPALCSECESGKWHGEFAKKSAVELRYNIGEDGFIYPPSSTPSHTKIIGPVSPHQGETHDT